MKLSLVAALVATTAFTNLASANQPPAALAKRKLLTAFVGQGTSMSIGAGAIMALSEQSSTVFNPEQIILSGSSSGSITSIYLSCHGITPESLKKLKSFLVQGNESINRSLSVLRESEDVMKKVAQFLAGKVPSLPIENLNPYVAAALGLENLNADELNHLTPEIVNSKSTCRAALPVVIVAANQEILENRLDPKHFTIKSTDIDLINQKLKPGTVFKTRGDKEVDYANFSVNWKATRLADYLTQEGQVRFIKNHPQLNLRKDGYVGKICTYHADELMAEALSAIPISERLCDIRVMRTNYDRLLAIRYSSAEPTYFDMIPETSPAQLDIGTGWGGLITAKSALHGTPVDAAVPSSRERMYWGGFVMPLVASDIRRALPHIRVFATGFNRLDMTQEGKIFQAMSLINHETVSKRLEYWSDFTVRFSKDIQKKIRNRGYTRDQEFEVGYAETKKCLEDELGIAKLDTPCRPNPSEVVDPDDEEEAFLAKATEEALWVSEEAKNASAGENLPVWRGLGELLDKNKK